MSQCTVNTSHDWVYRTADTSSQVC